MSPQLNRSVRCPSNISAAYCTLTRTHNGSNASFTLACIDRSSIPNCVPQQLLHHTSHAHRLLHTTVPHVSSRLRVQQAHMCATHVPVAALPHSQSCSVQALDERLMCIMMYMYACAQDKQHCQCILAALHAVSGARPWRCTSTTRGTATSASPQATHQPCALCDEYCAQHTPLHGFAACLYQY